VLAKSLNFIRAAIVVLTPISISAIARTNSIDGEAAAVSRFVGSIAAGLMETHRTS
jgi:hypothetical protein